MVWLRAESRVLEAQLESEQRRDKGSEVCSSGTLVPLTKVPVDMLMCPLGGTLC